MYIYIYLGNIQAFGPINFYFVWTICALFLILITKIKIFNILYILYICCGNNIFTEKMFYIQS